MANQKQLDDVYMGTAMLHAKLSHSRRTQVGAVLVTNQGITITGYNGSHVGASNVLETTLEDGTLVTNPSTIHAEANIILKAAREGVSVLGSTLYLTLSPCELCSAMIVQAGIKRLVYNDTYRDISGLNLIKDSGMVNLEKYTLT